MQAELIETLRLDATKKIPLLNRHLNRLKQSAYDLGYPCEISEITSLISKKIETVASQEQLTTASDQLAQERRVRLLLDAKGTVHLNILPLEHSTLPVKIALAGAIFPESGLLHQEKFLRYKTTYRPWYAEGQAWLEDHKDYFDLIYLNQLGQVCEGTRTNIYLFINQQWHTPPLSCGLLPGVMRAQLLDSEPIRETLLTVDHLYQAEKIRLSNALRGWIDAFIERRPPD